jgi:spore coat protein CotH
MVFKRFRVLLVMFAVAWTLPGIALAQTPPDPADAFFDDSTLHEIRLSINTRDWTSLTVHFQENTYYPADFRWNDQVVRFIGIRSRGTGSRSGVKPGLRIDFDRYTTGQKFLGRKSFLLRNQTQDPSGLRERVSMAFFRRMGVKAVREAHVKLYVNNLYAGLYTIVESLDKDFLQNNLGENGGWLYEYHFDNEAVAAGAAPFVFQYLGPDPALYVPVPFKPETREDDPQGEVIARWIQAINDTNAASWRTNMAQYLDLPKFIRFLAVENFLGEEDGSTGDYGPNNFYLYRFLNTTLFMFQPWDKSNTFWENANYSIFRNIEFGPVEKRNRLVLRAFQEPDLRQLYLDTLLECAASAAEGATPEIGSTPAQPGWLEQEIIREYDQIRAAALADTLIFSNSQFEAGIEDVKAFARGRSDSVRQQVAAARPGS